MKRVQSESDDQSKVDCDKSLSEDVLESEGRKMVVSSKRPKKNTEKPGFDKRMFEETSSFISNGMRYIKPYYFTFTTHCKGRWFGKTLIDIFTREFRMESPAYYEAAVRNGKITVDDQVVSPEEVLKQNQLIKTRIHRHEPPVMQCPIEFVKNDDTMVVINKPSSIPVHPCGRYRHNTIVFILGEDYGLTNLHTIHRIDRLTSGILMFAKTVSKAQEMEACVKGRLVQKEYLCRVLGEFPREKVVCCEPIAVVSHKMGVCQVKPDGKEAKTEFTLVSFNGKSSLVRCLPYTGRMHQIRVHLQYLGFPILNDPIYNNHCVWGPDNGKGGTSKDIKDILAAFEESRKDAILRLKACTKKDKSSSVLNCQTQHCSSPKGECNDLGPKDAVSSFKEPLSSSDLKSSDFDPDCSECRNPIPDPTPSELVMYLHALSYKGPGWEYKTSIPYWAGDDWNVE